MVIILFSGDWTGIKVTVKNRISILFGQDFVSMNVKDVWNML